MDTRWHALDEPFDLAMARQGTVADSGIDFATRSGRRAARSCFGRGQHGGGGISRSTIGSCTRSAARARRFRLAVRVPALSASMAACQLSMEYGVTGPVITHSAACATSVICFLDALRMIQRGEVDVVSRGGLGGALPGPIGSGGRRGRWHARAIKAQRRSAARVTPFDKHRDGFVYGEGAGVVMIDSRQHALTAGRRYRGGADRRCTHRRRVRISAPEPTATTACMAMTRHSRDAVLHPTRWKAADTACTELLNATRRCHRDDARSRALARMRTRSRSSSTAQARWSATRSGRR